MASEPDPSGIGSVIHLVGVANDAYGDEVRFYVSGDEVLVGDIVLDPDTRDDFARLWMEACRRADGEPPAMPGQEEARTWPCCAHCTRRPCAGHPYPCADGCNGAEGAAVATAGPHECSFPVQPPNGSFFAPGPCLTCGKPYVLAQAERHLAEAQAALSAAQSASGPGRGSDA